MSLGSTQPAAVAPADRLDTLPPWDWGPLDPDAPRTLGWHAIAWAEAHDWTGFPGLPEGWRGLTQPNGPRARKPFQLTQRQQQFLLWFYALNDDAQWIYSYGTRRLAKGSGKSPFAAVHCLIELLAPVRLESFRRGAPGGCDGRQVDMPLVQIAATAESQTANTMRMVRAFAPKGSHLVDFYHLDPGLTRYYGAGERKLEVITSSVSASEGAESSFVVEDELEHWKPSNGGPELAATLADNLAKSGARALGTCNAWKPGEATVAESDWEAWVLQEEGRLRDDAGRILYDAVIAPPDTDMGDADSLERALQWVYGDCEWKRPHGPDGQPLDGSPPDVRPIMARIWGARSSPDDAQRKYLNRPTASLNAWISQEEWSVLADRTKVVADGEDVVLFFDGSKSKDATALVGCRLSDGHIFTVGVWEPDPGDPDDIVPTGEVDLAVARSFQRWNVVGFFADVREWESFTKVSWPDAYRDGLRVMAVPGGKDPQPIAWDMRSHTFEFTTECELVRNEIWDRCFTHDGDPRLGRHVVNAWTDSNRYGVSIRKEAPDSRRKIDAAVCMIGARMVRRRVLAAPAPKVKQPGNVVAWGRR